MIAGLFPMLFGYLSPAGARGRLSILIFHRVLPQPDPLFPDEPDAARFEQQMRWITRWFNVLPLSEAVARLQAGALPARALAITFDDGYADNATVAAPLLQRLGLTATFFVATGVLGGGRMWNDTVIEALRRAPDGPLDLGPLGLGRFSLTDAASRRVAIERVIGAIKRLPYGERRDLVERIAATVGVPLPDDLMMSAAQVRELVTLGMSVGGHTVTHPILRSLDDATAEQEIARGRDDLVQITGEPIELFAYPNGVPGVDYDARHVAMARRCSFAAAVSTAHGVATRGADLYQLPRFTPWDRIQVRYALRMAGNLMRPEFAVA
ncbi:MAG: polysaccharide deacetylase [Rhodanobacteraceae bacterium]|jgi:peptidoglycan/xylan/chitin deacetylase (PgdA/CDA1 family)